MKCPNCGFDCDGNFCTMCGASLKSQSPQTENKQNPYINIENKQPLNNSASAVQNQNNTNYANTAQQNNYQNIQAQPQQSNFRVHSLNSRRIFLIFHSKDQTVL